jgi:hypothetical protein
MLASLHWSLAWSFITKLARHASRRLKAVSGYAADRRRLQPNHVLAVTGLMPLVMKGRNEGELTRDDRERLRVSLKRLLAVSPYLIVLIMPGGLVFLPVLAWWLDRRRRRRGPGNTGSAARRPTP